MYLASSINVLNFIIIEYHELTRWSKIITQYLKCTKPSANISGRENQGDVIWTQKMCKGFPTLSLASDRAVPKLSSPE